MMPRRPGKPSVPKSERVRIGLEVCREISTGKSLRAACKDRGIDDETVRGWLLFDVEQLFGQYARARQLQGHALVDEILDDVRNGEGVDPQILRVRVDALKWVASKLLPRVYGDKLTIDGDPNNPLTVQHTINYDELAGRLSREERELVLELMDRREARKAEKVARRRALEDKTIEAEVRGVG